MSEVTSPIILDSTGQDIADALTDVADAINAGNATAAMLAYVENGSTATQPYVKGTYICWQSLLYTADTAINAGDAFSSTGANKNLTAVGGGGLNEVLFVDIPYNSFEWFTGIPAFRVAYDPPTGYGIAAINVYCTNGNAAFEPRYSGGYIWIAGLTNRGVSIDQSYVIVCTVVLRKL